MREKSYVSYVRNVWRSLRREDLTHPSVLPLSLTTIVAGKRNKRLFSNHDYVGNESERIPLHASFGPSLVLRQISTDNILIESITYIYGIGRFTEYFFSLSSTAFFLIISQYSCSSDIVRMHHIFSLLFYIILLFSFARSLIYRFMHAYLWIEV